MRLLWAEMRNCHVFREMPALCGDAEGNISTVLQSETAEGKEKRAEMLNPHVAPYLNLVQIRLCGRPNRQRSLMLM